MDHRRRTRFLPCILLTVLIFALLVSGGNQSVHAQSTGDVNLTAQAGFNGYCKENRWIPVRVTVENKGADLNARIRVAYQNDNGGLSAYATDISLPTTSRKEFFLYLFPQNNPGKLTVSLMVADRALVTIPLSIACISSENLLIGLLTDDPSAYNSLSQATPLNGFARVAQLRLADLPDRSQGWEGLDALVVSGLDMGAISDKQREALNAWLAQGGKLLIAGGPKWQSAAGGLNEFLPIDVNATQNISSLSELQSYFKATAPLEGQAALVTVGQLRSNAEVLVEQDGVPVLIQKQVGFGTVYYLAADPALQPLSGWSGMEAVYSHLLGAHSLRPSWADSSWDANAANQALSALNALSLPPTLYILCLLGLYILVIGPLNYFVVRRIKRQELAWISIPALVIVFTLVAYFSGSLIHGTRPILNRLAIVQAWDGVDQAQVHALVGIYSPDRTKYVLQAGDSFLPYPFDNKQTLQANQDWLSLQQGSEMLLPDVLVESGGMKAAAVNGSLPAITFSHDLVISLGSDDPVLAGKITNTSQYTLKDAMLITPDGSKNLGDFAPGVAKQVQTSLTVNPDGSDFYNLQSQMLYSNYPDVSAEDKIIRQNALMRAVLPAGYARNKGNSGIYLMGWVDDARLPASLQGKESDSVDTTLYVLMLSPTFKLKPGALKLSPGLFIWESSNPEWSPYPSYNTQSIPANGYVLSFRLAAPLHYGVVKSLTLSLNRNSYTSANTPNGISASLWDWERAGWVQTQNLVWGNIDIPDAARYVGPAGEIRLKINKDGNLSQNFDQVGSSYVTLVVEP